MDSMVQTKSPNTRRSKYIIVGLIAVICVLCFQLHRENTIKKELITRKSYLLSKLYDCRVTSEKYNEKYKDKRTQNEKLTADLAAKTTSYDEMSKKYNDLSTSYQTQTEELQSLQQATDKTKDELATLKENYENAMSSVETMKGKLDEAMKVCDQHKENSRSANLTSIQRTRELELCKEENVRLEEEKEALVASEQDLQKKLAEKGQTKSARSVANSPTIEKEVKHDGYIPDKNPDRPAQNTYDQDEPSPTKTSVTLVKETTSSEIQTRPPKTPTKEAIQSTPTSKRPTTKQTFKSLLLSKDETERDELVTVKETTSSETLTQPPKTPTKEAIQSTPTLKQPTTRETLKSLLLSKDETEKDHNIIDYS